MPPSFVHSVNDKSVITLFTKLITVCIKLVQWCEGSNLRSGMECWKVKVVMKGMDAAREGETESGRRTDGKGKMEEEFNQSLFLHYFLF